MSSAPSPPILVSRCGHCHGRFLPRPGPCPRCGSLETVPNPVDPIGTVRAATSLEAPAAGWRAPHRLALVELAESVHVLAVVDGELPPIGAVVAVWRDGEIYYARASALPHGRP